MTTTITPPSVPASGTMQVHHAAMVTQTSGTGIADFSALLGAAAATADAGAELATRADEAGTRVDPHVDTTANEPATDRTDAHAGESALETEGSLTDAARAQQIVDAMLRWLPSDEPAGSAGQRREPIDTPAEIDTTITLLNRSMDAQASGATGAAGIASAPSASARHRPATDKLTANSAIRPDIASVSDTATDDRPRAAAHLTAGLSSDAGKPPADSRIACATGAIGAIGATAAGLPGLAQTTADATQAMSMQAGPAGVNATASALATSMPTSTVASPPHALHIPVAFGSDGWPQAFGQQVLWSARHQLQSASLTLHPPQLGPVHIELQLTDRRATAQFISNQADVRQAIEQALPQLKVLFASTGLELQQASVDSRHPDPRGQQERPDGSSPPSVQALRPSMSIDADTRAARARPAVAHRLLDTYA